MSNGDDAVPSHYHTIHWSSPSTFSYICIKAEKGGTGLELIFASIKDAIRLRIYLSANGLHDSIQESKGQFMYSFQPNFMKKDRYIQAITSFIQEVKRNEWVNDTLQKTYHYENELERSHILDIINEMFSGKRKDLIDYAGPINENKLLKSAVEDLINYEGTVLFQSFMRFRLKHYFEQVNQYLDIAIDEYKMEQEYQMFINMLRNYLKDRKPKLSTIHLHIDHESTFYDEKIRMMENVEIKKMLDQRLLANHPVYVDSTIIAPLLSIAPQKIYLYTDNEDQPLVRTLHNIFEERLSVLSTNHIHTLNK